MLFNDPSHTAYDYWDLKLLKAFYFSEDFIRSGVPIWWDESDDVVFDVEKRISRSRAATEQAEKKESSNGKDIPPGRYYIPIPRTRGGASFPTFEEWLTQQERKKGKK